MAVITARAIRQNVAGRLKMAEDYIKGEAEIRQKLMEYRVLTGQLRRYWKKLVRESLVAIKESGVRELDISEDREHKVLFEYARGKLPSLHRRFYQKSDKHRQLERELADASRELTVGH